MVFEMSPIALLPFWLISESAFFGYLYMSTIRKLSVRTDFTNLILCSQSVSLT